MSASGGPSIPAQRGTATVYQHTLLAEAALGRMLPAQVRIHHVNGDEADNAKGNLVLCQDDAYHMVLHMRQRALDACGNANWRKCPYCLAYDDTTNMIVHAKGKKSPAYCHRECRIARQNQRHAA